MLKNKKIIMPACGVIDANRTFHCEVKIDNFEAPFC